MLGRPRNEAVTDVVAQITWQPLGCGLPHILQLSNVDF